MIKNNIINSDKSGEQIKECCESASKYPVINSVVIIKW